MRDAILGTLKRYENFPSQFVAPRHVEVWLPPGYDDRQPLPVIYMHDGQNLFESALAYAGVDWGIDEAMVRLATAGIGPAIVVGMWNTARRVREYMPQRAVENAAQNGVQADFVEAQGGLPVSDNYLRFVVDEVKAHVDATYATLPNRAHTFIMGSSMGGLISLYALCEYPTVFGGAGCVSTHWPAGKGVVVDYVKQALPPAGQHRLYFDYGTETLDAEYEPYQKKVDVILQSKGYVQGQDWATHRFEGAAHSEPSWRERVDIPLKFLLA